jgi:hypothetical protein
MTSSQPAITDDDQNQEKNMKGPEGQHTTQILERGIQVFKPESLC